MSGSPLIPVSLIYLLVGGCLGVCTILYLFFHSRLHGLPSRHWRLQWLSISVMSILVILSLASICFISYLSLTPTVSSTILSPEGKLIIDVTYPIHRKALTESISPSIPGRWVFESPLYATHLYRRLVFLPDQTWENNATYTISLQNLKNFFPLTSAKSLTLFVHSPKTPDIITVKPSSLNQTLQYIDIHFDQPNTGNAIYDFRLTPRVPFHLTHDSVRQVYTLLPQRSFTKGMDYTLEILKTNVIRSHHDNTIIERKPQQRVYYANLQQSSVLGIQETSNEFPITIRFSDPMDHDSTEHQFSITPPLKGLFSWPDERTLLFTPESWTPSTTYTYIIGKYAKTLSGDQLNEETIHAFTTKGTPTVQGIFPEQGWTGVATDNHIKVTFDQPVDHVAAETLFSITPNINGSFSWDGNVLIFTPSSELAFDTSYTVGIEINSKKFSSTFSTQASTTKLEVPVYLQKYSLSCEIAALRMALAYRGVQLSEDTILEKVGIDPSAHTTTTWGNPFVGFVGNVNGRQMVSGYGVHWEPIARAARTWRDAHSFEHLTIRQLTKAIQKNNPLVIWTYAKHGTPTAWYTPAKDKIEALRDEHAVTVVGFVGSPGNPSAIIINDPLVGQVQWDRESFEKKWDAFGRSGVIIL